MKRNMMKVTAMKLGLLLLVAAVAAGMVLPQATEAALPAPNFMPGMPMIAGEQIIVMWMVVPGAAKYRLYLNDKLVGETASLQYIVPAPKDPGNYTFTVKAVDAAGAESPASPGANVSIIKLLPPTEIIGLATGDQIRLRWQGSAGAVIYDVFRRKKGEGDFQLLISTQDINYADKTVAVDTTYEYAIKSKDSSGKSSDYSEAVEVFNSGQAEIIGGATERKGFDMHAVPLKLVREEFMEFSPYGIAFSGKSAAVVGGGLYYFPDMVDQPFESKPLLRAVPEGESTIAISGFVGVAFDSEGNILASSRNTIYRIDPVRDQILDTYKVPVPEPGELKYIFRGKERENKKTPSISDVIEAPDGTIYGSDVSNGRIVSFSPDGDFLGTLGLIPDEEPSDNPPWYIMNPNFLENGEEESIFITSVFGIQTLDRDGNTADFIGGAGDTVGSFGLVGGIAFDRDNNLWTADVKQSSIQVFGKKPENEEGKQWEPIMVASNEAKDGSPPFVKPVGIAWGPAEAKGGPHLYVISRAGSSILQFEVLWDQVK